MITEFLTELIGQIEETEVNRFQAFKFLEQFQNEVLDQIVVFIHLELCNLMPQSGDACDLQLDLRGSVQIVAFWPILLVLVEVEMLVLEHL